MDIRGFIYESPRYANTYFGNESYKWETGLIQSYKQS